ncbi:MAG: Cof-type HAD-IIB family hydrolase [Coprococcus sp.]
MINKDTKILFFDIDGTLITDDGRRYFPDSAKKALALARENGHLIFINTGRVYCNITEEIKAAGFDGYVCGCGSCIIYRDKQIFYSKLSKELCYDTAIACRRYNMYGMYEHRDKVYVDGKNKANESLIDMAGYFRNNGVFVGEDIESEDFVFDKFCAWYEEDNEHLPEFQSYVNKNFDYIDREGNFCEIVQKGYSKATGIQYLLDYFNLPLENAYAFGDGNNDEPMLSYVPNSIIMAKGPEELKKKVMMVTDDVMDNGIYNAMKKLEII